MTVDPVDDKDITELQKALTERLSLLQLLFSKLRKTEQKCPVLRICYGGDSLGTVKPYNFAQENLDFG